MPQKAIWITNRYKKSLFLSKLPHWPKNTDYGAGFDGGRISCGPIPRERDGTLLGQEGVI